MKTLRCLRICACLAAIAPTIVWAADPKEEKEKSPAQLAWDSFSKLVDDKEAKVTPERQQQIIQAGIDFLVTHPKDNNAGKVINKLVIDYVKKFGKPEQSAQRVAWYSQLHLVVVNKQFDKSNTEEAKAALAALDAAAAYGETREQISGDNFKMWRERIDEMLKLKHGFRFMADREMEFVEVLKFSRPAAAEAHLKKLAAGTDKKTAERAREELNFMEVRKQPYELKFTALDGRAVDFAQLRGRVVVLFFFTKDSKDLEKDLEGFKDLYSTYNRKKFEIVGVCYDKDETPEAVTTFVKRMGMKWPVYFDGKGSENEFGEKLNAKSLPTAYLFDANGILVKTKLRLKDVPKEVDRILSPKK